MNGRGQAMAEFAVAVTVLATLLLGMPVISRYHELQVATIEGARRLAFEDSWRRGGAPGPDAGALRAALFPSNAGEHQPIAAALDSRYAVSGAPGRAGQVATAWLAPFRIAAAAGFDLRDHALYRAELEITATSPAGLPEPFAGEQIALREPYVLLGDEWAGSGPDQVARRAGGLLIARQIPVLRPLLSLGKGLLGLVEPAIHEFCPGIVDPEQVPADRLTGGQSADVRPATSWRATC
jgi:hypothetical protein